MTVTHAYLFNLYSDCSPRTCSTTYYCCPQYYCCGYTYDTCNFKSQYRDYQAQNLPIGSVKFTECLYYIESTYGTLYPVTYGFYEATTGKIYIETSNGCSYAINTPVTFAVDDSNSRIILRNGALETKLNNTCVLNCLTANSIPFNTNTSLCNSYGNQCPVSFGYSISPAYDICDATKFNVCKQYLATNNIATRQPVWANEANYSNCYNGDTNCTLTKNYRSWPSSISDVYTNLDCQKFCRQSFARPFSVHKYYYNSDSCAAYSGWHDVLDPMAWCNGVGAAGNITCFTGRNRHCNLLTQVCWITTLGPLNEKESAACYSTFIPSNYCPVTVTGSGTAWCQAYNYLDVYNGYGINSQIVFTCFIQNSGHYNCCWCSQILPWCTTSNYTPAENVAVRVSRSRTLVLNACTGMTNYECWGACCNLMIPSSCIYPFMYSLNTVSNVSGSWTYESPSPCTGHCTQYYLKADQSCTNTLVLPTCQQYWESKTEPADTSILATMHVVEPAMLYFSFAGQSYKGSYPSNVINTMYEMFDDALCCNKVPVNCNYPTSCYICHNNTWFTLRIPVVPKRECLVAAIQHCSGLCSNGVYNILPNYSSNCYFVGNSWFGFQGLNNFSCCYDTECYTGNYRFYNCVRCWLKSDPTSDTMCCYIDLNCFYSWLKDTLECYNLEIFKGYALDITMCPYNRYDSYRTKAIQIYATNNCYADESYLQPGGRGTCPNGITNFACPERNFVCDNACQLKSIMTNLVNNCNVRNIQCYCGSWAMGCFICEYNCTDFFGNGCCCSPNNTWHVNCYDASNLIETAVTVYTCCSYSTLNDICQCMGSKLGYYKAQDVLAKLRNCCVPGTDDVCIGDPNFNCQVFMSCNRPETYYCHAICSTPLSFYSSYACKMGNYSGGAFGSAGEFRVIPKITIDYQLQNKTYFKGWPTACDI